MSRYFLDPGVQLLTAEVWRRLALRVSLVVEGIRREFGESCTILNSSLLRFDRQVRHNDAIPKDVCFEWVGSDSELHIIPGPAQSLSNVYYFFWVRGRNTVPHIPLDWDRFRDGVELRVRVAHLSTKTNRASPQSLQGGVTDKSLRNT